MSTPILEVLEPGLLTTVQDSGRFGYQKYGVPVSGGMDTFSLKIANLLVANSINEGVLEITGLGIVKLKILNNTAVALTGADLTPMIDTSPLPMWRATEVKKGKILSLGGAKRGFRAYLSVAGGIDIPLVLGSRSTYCKAKIGGIEGRPLRKGDIISSFLPGQSLEEIARRYLPEDSVPDLPEEIEARVIMGPQDDYFKPEGIQTFLNSWYSVSPESDRTGYRLRGPRITHKDKTDIITDAIPLGAIQVPGDGLPIILMADRGPTGGYPKIACILSVDVDKVGQLKPGDKIKFKKIDIKEAHKILQVENGKLLKINNILNEKSTAPAKKRYRVIVEGETYEVTVEEMPG
ncbi:MAG: biotin-dependent carboxyltransferase family protein [Candidatus Aerophobetes bacterium]|nr:biotin-dependent carboxyltransferase family protein [Candidatus Aerophobetes bacterium]